MKRKYWIGTSVLLFFPIAAILHHAVFFRPTCILNQFEVRDYSIEIVKRMLYEDPSFYIAAALAVMAYVLGRFVPQIQPAALAFFVVFLPLSIWIWDIPGLERVVCYNAHDNRIPMKSRHLYILGAMLLLPAYYWLRKHLDVLHDVNIASGHRAGDAASLPTGCSPGGGTST